MELETKKATGPDGIPAKIVKLAANLIDSPLTNIINDDITKGNFSESAKPASVIPTFKKDDTVCPGVEKIDFRSS